MTHQDKPKRQTVTVKYYRKPGKTVGSFLTLHVRKTWRESQRLLEVGFR